jgi:pimeloyl-ACP methyl ester carboxylesterase
MMRNPPVAVILLLLATPAAAAIRWEPFALPTEAHELHAELGHLTVPLDRAHPDAGSAELAFVRLRAGEATARPPIVYLAGGPGSSGVDAARNPYALPSLARLARIGDVILLDQRGVGLSTPRPVCRATTLPPPQERFLPAQAAIARYVERTRACVAEWTAKGVDVSAFNVRESAADVDDLRKALGAAKVSLLAHSYGTHLALAVIRAYGAGIARAVLIGTAGPADMRKLPSMLDTQLGKLSLLAANDPAIARDVPDMAALLRRVLAKLEREPIAVTVTDRATKEPVTFPVGADTLRSFLVADLGDASDFPFFPALLLTIERNDPSILQWFAEKRYNQRSGVDLMVLGMRCSAGASASHDEEIAREARESPFRNAVNFPFPDVCSALPVADLGDPWRAPLISNVPVLFISGTLDSNTPPYQAEQVRWGLPNATHLIVANAGHEDMEPNETVQTILADYLDGKDVSDRRVALPKPRFIAVDEAKKMRGAQR